MLSLPNVGGVRLATLEDLPRIAIVAASAFFWSPTFRFQRPHYKEFPMDTINSYSREYEAAILNPTYVVLVTEDVLEADEAEHVYNALQFAYQPLFPGERGIVGVCSILLKPGSCYVGHLQPKCKHVSATKPDLTETINNAKGYSDLRSQPASRSMKRDQCVEALRTYDSLTGPSKLEYLANKMRLSTLAVSPIYWRRGHATSLVSFCTQLADLDEALLGVSATPHGAMVIAKAGFEECVTVRIKRLAKHNEKEQEDPPNAADVILWIGVRIPCSRSPSNNNASGSASPMGLQRAA